MPFQETVIQSTERYDAIIKGAGEGFEPEIRNFDNDHYYIMGCSIILMQYYGYDIDFRRPFYYEVPDVNGMMRYYRLLYNGDYISIYKKSDTAEITKEDVDELLDNFEDIKLWIPDYGCAGSSPRRAHTCYCR